MLKEDKFNGLTTEEVNERKEHGLVNTKQEKKIKSNWEILFNNLWTLFNLFNFLIAIALFVIGAYTNMFFILIIIVNIAIGTIQEINAKNLIKKLSIISESKVDVIRNGQQSQIAIEEIVLDDTIILIEGTQICADSILIDGEVEVNESLLTGEADNILKKVNDTLLSGSYVVSGKCCAKVKNVGSENYVSKITDKVQKQKKVHSELLDSMKKVTRWTSFFIIPIGIALFVQAYFVRNTIISDSVISTSAGLLGMLPKGLVLLISISLATGVIKLSNKKVLIQEMHSIETLARVDMLCIDKTGTITEAKMRVSNLYKLDEKSMPISIYEAITAFAENMNDNNSTLTAIKDHYNGKSSLKMVDKVSFSSDRKWSSVTFASFGTLVLGAPEKLLAVSDFNLPKEIVEMQKMGKRILLLGYVNKKIIKRELSTLKIVAAIELDDPLKKNAKETFSFLKKEGVPIKVISGDSPLTVSSIAKKAGIDGYEKYIDMSGVEDKNISQIVDEYNIFARVSPNQKALIIQAFQAKGRTVAMTGDGVNDAIALREANIGITFPNGSNIAKQLCEIVFLTTDFRLLEDVIMEGRRVVNNITNIARIFFIKTIYSVGLSILCIILNIPFPFIPIQITLIDLVIEAYTSFFITFEANKKQVRGTFLKTVIKNAFPYALTIILSTVAIMIISSKLAINQFQATTLMYYIIGFVSILAVIKVCFPFNKLRLFLASTTALGFFVVAYLFRGLLKLEILTTQNLILYLIIAILCLPILKLSEIIINKLVGLKNHNNY